VTRSIITVAVVALGTIVALVPVATLVPVIALVPVVVLVPVVPLVTIVALLPVVALISVTTAVVVVALTTVLDIPKLSALRQRMLRVLLGSSSSFVPIDLVESSVGTETRHNVRTVRRNGTDSDSLGLDQLVG
jgi:hypothetical protein